MLGRMKLATKVLTSCCFIIAIAIIVGVVGFRGLTRTSDSLNIIATTLIPGLDDARLLENDLVVIFASERGLIHAGMFADPDMREKQFAKLDTAWADVDKLWKAYEQLPHPAAAENIWQDFVPKWNAWKSKHQAVRSLADEKGRLLDAGVSINDPRILAMDKQLLAASLDTRTSYINAEQSLLDLGKQYAQEVNTERSVARQSEASAKRLLIVVLVFGVILSLVIGIWFMKYIGGIIHNLLNETNRLSAAGTRGHFDERGDTDNIDWEFRPIIEGFNATLDSVVVPLNAATQYIGRIAQGDIPEPVTAEYQGVFNTLKESVNRMIGTIRNMVTDAHMLREAAVRGELDTRADVSKHHGEFQTIIQGMNDTL
ncbi:MAG TPA: MCP four helix bundle domain-containing protein, partial [Armatimonadota bacterium]|nr:MCP four helix bundle domain-containing protein [Armatimonadota bacterium]